MPFDTNVKRIQQIITVDKARNPNASKARFPVLKTSKLAEDGDFNPPPTGMSCRQTDSPTQTGREYHDMYMYV